MTWREHPVAAAISEGLPPFSFMRIMILRLSSNAVLLSFLPSCFSISLFYRLFYYMSIYILPGQ
jgi:hypothetical protein